MTDQAVDLSRVAALQAARQKADQDEAQRKALARIEAWDKAMRRTFKGIMPSNLRHRFLAIAGDRDA